MKKLSCFLAAIALIASCSSPFAGKVGGSGAVTVFIADSSGDAGGTAASSRTVVPNIAGSVDTYTVTLTSKASPAFASKMRDVSSGSSAAFADVESGLWDIAVDAKKAGAVIASAAAADQVVTSAGLTLSLALLPALSGGSGDLSLTVEFSASSGVTSLSCLLEDAVGDASTIQPSGIVISGGDPHSAAISATGLPAGTYSLAMTFIGSGGAVLGKFRESVNIMPGLTSDKWVAANGTLADRRTFGDGSFAATNAYLSDLRIPGLNATQYTFASATSSYTVSDLPSETLVFTPTQSVPGQKIEYEWNGASEATPTDSGSESIHLAMKAGANALVVTVTAPDRVTVGSYTVTINQTTFYTSSSDVAMKMVRVPAGTFQRDVTPANTAYVSEFSMGKYEVTRAQYLAVMGTDPSAIAASSGTDDPVQNVNWYHAIAFCNKLSLAEGLTPVYAVSGIDFATLTYAGIPITTNATWNVATIDNTVDGYRLPTQMEWMWAAMGATSDRSNGYTGTGINTTGYNKGYAGSTEPGVLITNIDGYVWSSENSASKTHPAGTKLPNELGLYDMSGNAQEWCWDRDGVNPDNALINYQGSTSFNGCRSSRGGNRNIIANDLDLIMLNPPYPYIQDSRYGFRVARGFTPASVNYYANGSTSGSIPATTAFMEAGTSYSIQGNSQGLVGAVIQDGIRQRFVSWNTRSDGLGTEYLPGASIVVSPSIRLYAQYTTDTSVIAKIGPAGGFIFHDKGSVGTSDTGPIWRYLELAPLDQSAGISWGNVPLINTVSEFALGGGYINTPDIISKYSGFDYAANLCGELALGGYDDWYLPSSQELGGSGGVYNTLFRDSANSTFPNYASIVIGGYYWTSTKYNDMTPIYQYFNVDGSSSSAQATSIANTYRVRAVRRF